MIKRKEFDAGTFKKRVFTRREDHPIAKFLKKNLNSAFKAKEIGRRVKMNENTVRSMIAKLIGEGFVVHKAPYFAWKKK